MKTAVEWLYEQISVCRDFTKEELLEQALEIFEKQIIESFHEGNRTVITTAKEYYNRTFKPQ